MPSLRRRSLLAQPTLGHSPARAHAPFAAHSFFCYTIIIGVYNRNARKIQFSKTVFFCDASVTPPGALKQPLHPGVVRAVEAERGRAAVVDGAGMVID